MDHYVERLPDELARMILDTDYSDENYYQIVHDRDGSCIVGYNKETGERVDFKTGEDFKLDVEDFKFLSEEMETIEEETSTDYTVRGFGIWKWVAIAASISFVGFAAYALYLVYSIQ